MLNPIQRSESLTDQALRRIRDLIIDGSVPLGAQLSEAVLAAEMGISKTPVREALVRLQSEGLVEVIPQRGSYVFRLDDAQVAEVCRYRVLIESAALGEAMQRSPAALVAGLRASVERMRAAHDAHDLAALPRIDQEFHETIIEHCGNAYLRNAYGLVSPIIRSLRSRLPVENSRVDHCQENHAAILRLIESGDAAASWQALGEHIDDTIGSYLEASRRAHERRAPIGLAPLAQSVPG